MPRVFYDGFENQVPGNVDTTFWSEDANSTGPGQVVTSALDLGLGPPSGNQMLRVNWQQGSPQQTARFFTFPANWGGSETLFIRFKYRCDADFDHSIGGLHCFRMNPSTSDLLTTGPNSTQMQQDCLFDNVRVFGTVDLARTVFTDTSKFHLYEIYLKNSAPTEISIWLEADYMSDGSQTAHAISFTWTSGKFSRFNITSNWSGGVGGPPDNNNHLYIDEFEVFADTACGLGFDEATTGSMSDASIQVAATGLAMFLS